MNTEAFIGGLRQRGIVLASRDGRLIIDAPKDELRTDEVEHLRQRKTEILAFFDRSAAQTIAPDSRHPLIGPEVRGKIESIEADARAKGWPAELLWNNVLWGCPRGLAALLDPEDEIIEVTAGVIAIRKCGRDIQRFRRQIA